MSKTVAVATNDLANRQVALVCKGEVRVVFRDLEQVVKFDRIQRSAGPQSKTIALHRGDGGPISPEVIPDDTGGVKATVREIQPGEHYELDVTVSPPWPNKLVRGLIRIKTGISEVPEETIRVAADVVARVETVPREFRIPDRQIEAGDYPVAVIWDQNAAQKVIGALVNDTELGVRIVEKDKGQQVVLNVPAGYRKHSEGPVVTVRTDDSEVPEFTIPIAFVQTLEGNEGKELGGPARPPIRRPVRPTTRATRPAAPGKAPQPQEAPNPAQSGEPDNAAGPQNAPPAEKSPTSDKAIEPENKPVSPEKKPQPAESNDEGTKRPRD